MKKYRMITEVLFDSGVSKTYESPLVSENEFKELGYSINQVKEQVNSLKELVETSYKKGSNAYLNLENECGYSECVNVSKTSSIMIKFVEVEN